MKSMAAGFTYGTIHLDFQGWECQTSTGVGALGMDGIGSSARHVWRPISPSLNFCNFSFKRKVNETRMYDPVMSSFLSVDNYVQSPENSQNFNRYAYCLNNPLKYTDPSGEMFGVDDIVAAAIAGAIINGFVQTATGNVQNFGDWCHASLIGAAGGALGAGIGGAVAGSIGIGGFCSGAVAGAAGGAAGGFVSGAGNAWLGGASLGQGLGAGFCGAGVGVLSGAAVGGLMEGFGDMLNGYSFWNGTRSAGEVVTVSAIENNPDLQPFDPGTLGDNDCALANIAYTDRTLNGNMTPGDVKLVAEKGKNGGYMIEKTIHNYCEAKGHSYSKRTVGLTKRQRCAEAFENIKDGNKVHLWIHEAGEGMDHMVCIKSITKTPLISSKGCDVSRYGFSIMDPAYSKYVSHGMKYVGNAINAYYIKP